jgi:tight adherence protein C
MNPTLLTVLVFAMALVGGITLYESIFGERRDLSERLTARPGSSRPSNRAADSADRLIKWHVRRLRETKGKTTEQKGPEVLAQAGFRGIESVALFQLGRLALMATAGGVGVTLCIAAGRPWVLGIAGGFVVGYIVPALLVRRLARRRRRKIAHELPDVLALMVVSLEAGIGVTEMLKLVGRETERQESILGRELSAASAQMQAGMSFEDTMRDLGNRSGVEELKSLAALLIQSEKIGARLAPALRASADLLNSRRRMAAEEAARKTSVKMLFPLVFFVLPAMMIIIMGPAIIQIMAVFGKL